MIYRATGGEINPDAIGPAAYLGSQAGGSGVDKPYGGFVAASFILTVLDSQGSTTAGATGYAWVSTVSLLASVWGNNSPLTNSGYLLAPINIQIIGASTADGSQYAVGGRLINFRDFGRSGSLMRFRFHQLSTRAMDASQSAIVASDVGILTSDGTAVKVYFTGFIVSGPGSPN